MKYKDFPESLWTEINLILQKAKQSQAQPIAAFDADGTLWDTDLGENFFNYKINNKLVSLPEDPWNHYLQLKKVNNDPRPAYLWLAQICKGQNLTTVRKWSQAALDTLKPYPFFDEQKKMIELFLKNDIKVYIVTASIKWAVEPGALAIGLKSEDVIGIETLVEKELVTEQSHGIITYRQGKVDALLEKTKGQKPFFSSGNSEGDIELLDASTHMALAVSAASRDDRLFKTEKHLFELVDAKKSASDKLWRTHRFIKHD